MLNINLILFIIKTGIATALVILGVLLLLISRERWDSLMGKLLGIPDLEMPVGSYVFLKVTALASIAVGAYAAYFFFVRQ